MQLPGYRLSRIRYETRLARVMAKQILSSGVGSARLPFHAATEVARMPEQASQSFWVTPQGAQEGRFILGLNPRIALAALGVFVGYYLGAKIGFALTFHPLR
jgi:hypothetical protein